MSLGVRLPFQPRQVRGWTQEKRRREAAGALQLGEGRWPLSSGWGRGRSGSVRRLDRRRESRRRTSVASKGR